MMQSNGFSPHDLFPVAAMRCLAVVEVLGRSKSASSALTIQKAAIFDLALKNPSIARRIISELAPEKYGGLELPHVLYPGETDMGAGADTREIVKIAAILRKADIIRIESLAGNLVLKPKAAEMSVDIAALPSTWQITLNALKGLTAKSSATLQRSIFRESNRYDEQHVFITGTSGAKGRDQEL